MKSPKIKTLHQLASVLTTRSGRFVLCPGVWDLLHVGHVRHLHEAHTLGDADVFFVTVTPDRYVSKGPGRPAFTQEQRCEMLAALEVVDYVAVNEYPDHAETIRLLKPHVFVRGAEYESIADPTREAEAAAAKEVGCELAYTRGEVFSSSALINRHLTPNPAAEWLKAFPHTAEQVNAYLDAASSLKVLVAGEAIVDEYVWVDAIGKSGKEPILAVREVSRERHAGGATAVANHVKAFVGGFVPRPDEPTTTTGRVDQWSAGEFLTKTRLVSRYPQQKLIELYTANQLGDLPGPPAEDEEFDMVVVVDYGHGMFGCRKESSIPITEFLAVNVQNNADNHGYNTHEKYGHVDYLCLSEGELRLAARQRNGDLKGLVWKAAELHGFKYITVTRGESGVLCYNGRFVEAPAFTDHFTDRVGAGDAVLAVTSLLACQGAPVEVIALVANAVGALAVQVVGNRTAIDKAALQSFIRTLLK